MRTKLFLAFIVIILAALLSMIVFELMIRKDFDNYISSIRDDQIHWIMVSIEGAYDDGSWDSQVLSESIHWAMMLGLDIKILDARGKEVVPAHHYMESLSPSMKSRMEELFHMHTDINHTYAEFPIYAKSQKIGTLMARSFQKKDLAEKEAIFKDRIRHFLYFYLLIAGAGTILIGLLLSQYLSKPVMSLKKASEKIANGDFSVRIALGSSDEVGELARTFNKMAESLQKEEELRKHLMSNVAHELRTPLTVMKTHVEAMADGIVIDTQKGLENIEVEIERLIALVKGIEDITAAEASFFVKGEATQIDLKEFLSGLAENLAPSFQSQGLYFKIADGPNLVVTTDVEKLERILINILSNALKFTNSGGISIDYGIEGSKFFIEVRDTGSGIPESELPLIFNRFYRPEKSGVEGLGLGLAIAKELVDVMGGEITVNSVVGAGSRFRVSLPFTV